MGLRATAIVRAVGLGLGGTLLGTGLVSPGCKKKEQEVQYPPTATVNVPDAGAQDAAAFPEAAPPPDGMAVTDGGPQPLDIVTMQAMQDFIKARAKKEARGMKPYGDFFGGVVEEGKTVEHTIMIDSGRCYGVIAMGSPGVGELDIQVQAKPGLPVPLPGPIIAVDSNTGPEAAVSPCWKNPFPLSFPGVVVLKATRGKGPIGGQVYVK
jgi:hypothetical protein